MKTNPILPLLFILILSACNKNGDNDSPESGKAWPETLSGIHLSHIESGSSLDPNYTKSTQVYLCSNGNFYMSIVDSITGAEFDGLWQVADKSTKQAVLLNLQFSDGDFRSYQLSLDQNGIMVDGSLFQHEYNESQCN